MKSRISFYRFTGLILAFLLAGLACSEQGTSSAPGPNLTMEQSIPSSNSIRPITIFLAGDVMTGRGIDQILPHPSEPRLYEPVVKNAQAYVELVERANGPIPEPVGFAYIWGDALAELERVQPDVRIINLETSITTSDDYWPNKGINYRMHPQNIPCLTVAKIDYCSLANNHVLDWGYGGLIETLETLEKAKIHYSGAGGTLREAETPAVLNLTGPGRVLVFAYGLPTSGIPVSWLASAAKPGINLLPDLSDESVQHIKKQVDLVRKPGDIVVASIHWGGNWGYEIPPDQISFAHNLINQGGIDVIHGHSSHHFKGIEVYREKPILYGAGDFLNDYEGIGGHEEFRPDLALMYFVGVDPTTGKLVRLEITPMQIKQMQLKRASQADAVWIKDILNREGKPFGTSVEVNPDSTLSVKWE